MILFPKIFNISSKDESYREHGTEDKYPTYRVEYPNLRANGYDSNMYVSITNTLIIFGKTNSSNQE